MTLTLDDMIRHVRSALTELEIEMQTRYPERPDAEKCLNALDAINLNVRSIDDHVMKEIS